MDILNLADVKKLIQEEEALAEDILQLTANETLLSPLAQQVLSTNLYNRYLLEHSDMREDSPSRLGNFMFRGLDRINVIERSATEICRQLFGAEYAEFRCLSGIHAMQTTIAALTQPGDKVMRVATKDGGHFLTELICRAFGRTSCTYVFKDIGEIDLDQTRLAFEQEQPSLLYIDAMNYLFPFPLRELREIVGDTPIVFDASHTLGLIAGGQFQDPLREGADILQANTHKTFFGPQKGLIVGNNRGLMERISYVLSNGLVSSQHTASTLALFVALHETYYWGRPYAARVLENAQYLAGALHRRGVPILAAEKGFTRNHVFFIDVRSLGSGPVLLERLLRANISANRTIAFEHMDTLRFGVQEITRRGYSWDDLELIADWLTRLLLNNEDPDHVRKEVVELVRARRTINYCDAPSVEPTSKTGIPAAPSNAGHQAEMPIPTRSRWINIQLKREHVVYDDVLFDRARSLGQLAGTFEHQTDTAGNISFRTGDRIFVSASGAYIKDLSSYDFTEILNYSDGTLNCRGSGPPSSESYMHYLMRRSVDAKFIVHNHYIPGSELDTLDVVVIPPKEYGSIELAEAVAEAATRGQVIYVRRHGLVFWGRSLEECRSLLERFAAILKIPTDPAQFHVP
jgi:fluorothreonine transaldolase